MSKFEGIRFTDHFKGIVNIADNKKSLITFKDEGLGGSNGGGSFVVKIPMTHSSLLTRNKGMYSPAHMQKGGLTFLKPYNKPVLRGHDNNPFAGESDPIGRVKGVSYVDTSEKWVDADKKLKDLHINHMNDLSNTEAYLDYATYVLKKYNLGNKKDYQGMGHLEGVLDISDPDAIQKIKDGRYMTVSISASSTDAYCSICRRNLVKDGFCDHQRGARYNKDGKEDPEGELCVIMPASLSYDHVGFVNSPADPHAHSPVLYTGKDCVELPPLASYTDMLEAAARCFVYTSKDNIQSLDTESDVNIVKINDEIQGVINAMAEKTIDAVQTPVTEPAKTPESTETQVTDAVVTPAENTVTEEDAKKSKKDNSEAGNEDPGNKEADPKTGKEESKKKNKKNKKRVGFKGQNGENDSFVDVIHSLEDGTTKEEFAEVLKDSLAVDAKTLVTEFADYYKNYLGELDEASDFTKDFVDETGLSEVGFNKLLDKAYNYYENLISYDALIAEDGYKFFEADLEQDAKLSGEARKKLKGSTFCGPGRSFPVPDCAHVTAARRLIGRAKVGASTKARILSCVSRKAKSLGCGGKSKDETNQNAVDNTCPTCENNVSNQSVMQDKEILQKLNDFKALAMERGLINDKCTNCAQKLQEIQVLEAQIEGYLEEIDMLVLEKVNLENSYKQQLASKVVDMKILSGETITDRKAAIDQHMERESVSLQDSLTDLEKKVDLFGIASKRDNGISKEPTKKVENPVLQSADDKTGTLPMENPEKKSHLESQDEMYALYNKLCATHGKRMADSIIKQYQKSNN